MAAAQISRQIIQAARTSWPSLSARQQSALALDVPEAHVEVIDLVYGSRTMKAVLAEHLDQPADELSINIKLT